MTDPVLRRLGELSALQCFWGTRAASSPAGQAYGDAQTCAGWDSSRKLARQVEELRAGWHATPEYQASEEAAQQYQAFVAAHEDELAGYAQPLPATAEAWHAELREREDEVEQARPLAEDPSQPRPWDYQLALDNLQGFWACCPEPETEAEAG